MAHKNRFAKALRFATAAGLAFVVFTFALVQVQQHLLRHRAQLLFSDIRNLWIHPGNFADLQRLQKRWGAFGHYDGSCTAEHCAYSIILSSMGPPRWLTNDRLRTWTGIIFSLLGERDVDVLSGIIVRDDHMVLASLKVIISARIHDGLIDVLENEGGGYVLEGRIRSASRLFQHGEGPESELKREYEIGRPGACEGCIVGWVNMTLRTNIADIQRLTNINLECITRFKPCVNLDDLLPVAWSEYRREKGEDHESPYVTQCSVSPALLAREADNVALVEILKVHPPKYPDEERTHGATIRILERLKNGGDHPVGSTADIAYGMENVYAGNGESGGASRKLSLGDHVILLYPRSFQGEMPGLIDTPFCSLIPLSDATLKNARDGIAMDPSGTDLFAPE